MQFTRLNPVIRSASIYEKQLKNDECICYDSRIIYVISGDVTAFVDSKRLGHLSPGHILYIPAGTSYKLRGQYLRIVVITFDPTDDIPLPRERINPVTVSEYKESECHRVDLAPFDRVIHTEDMESDRDMFIEMCNIFTSGEGSYLSEISARLKLILLKLAESTDESALPMRMVTALDEYIRENVGDEISNTEIGAIFGYHPFYVSKVLKTAKGMTLRQYIIAHRLKTAKRLLELTDKSIAEIAEETGFTDASYFTKTFKSTFGMTPKEYRNGFKDDFV